MLTMTAAARGEGLTAARMKRSSRWNKGGEVDSEDRVSERERKARGHGGVEKGG